LIIQRLQTRNFGCLGEREFEFESGLNIIRGPNEAGKSTLQAALLTVLFQKADTTSQAVRRWQSWGAKNLFEITLEFTAAGHRWRLEKDFADKEVCLADLDSGEEWTEHSKVRDKIAQLVGTGSQDIYESTAAIRQQQITALEAGGELSDLLQQSVSGAASGVSVSDIIGQLDKALTELRRGLERAAPVNPGLLHLIQEEIVRLEGEIGKLEEDGQKIGQARQELREAEAQLEQLEPQIEQTEQLLEKIERCRKLEERLAGLESEWLRLHQDVERVEQLNREIAELNDNVQTLPEVSAEEAEKVKSLVAGIGRSKADIELHQNQLNEFDVQQQQLTAEATDLVGEESPRELIDRAVGLQDEQRAVQVRIDGFEQELRGVQHDLASRDTRRIRVAVGVLLALTGGVCGVLYSLWWLLLTLVGIVLAATGLFGTRPESAAVLIVRREKIESDLQEARSQRQQSDQQLHELLAELGVENVADLSRLLSNLSSRQNKLAASIEAAQEAQQQATTDQEEAQAALDQLVAERFSSADELLEVYRQREQLRGEIDRKNERREGILDSQQLEEMKKHLAALELDRGTLQQQLDSPELAHIDLDTLDIERLRNDLEGNKEAFQSLTEKRREARFIIEHSDFDPEHQLRAQEKLRAAQQRQQRLQQREEVYELTRGVIAEAYEETLSQTRELVEPHLADLLAPMTNGRYNQVRLAVDEFAPQVISPDKGEEARADELSWATREQVYLAARLALTRALWPDEGPPLLLDDPLVNFDERRYAATMNLLAGFAQDRQILFFTCSAEFDKYADHVIELPGPAWPNQAPASGGERS